MKANPALDVLTALYAIVCVVCVAAVLFGTVAGAEKGGRVFAISTVVYLCVRALAPRRPAR